MSKLPALVKSRPEGSDAFFVAGVVPGKRLFWCFITYFAVACLLRCFLIPVIGSAYLGGVSGDAGLYVWLIKSNLRDLFRLDWFSTTAFYPYTLSLGWSDNYILPALMAAPLLQLGLSLPLVYNLLHLAATAMNGLGFFVLFTHLTNFPRHAFYGGVAFMSLGVFAAHLGHPQLQWAFFLPLLLVGVVRVIHERSLASGVLTGLFFAGALATTAYYAVFGALLAGCFVVGVALLRPERFLDRRYFRPLVGGTLGLIPALPLLIPYFAVRDIFGGREIYEAHYFSASPISYLSASPFSALYSWTSGLSHAEANLFPGLVLLILPLLTLRRLWEVPPLRKLLKICFGLLIGIVGLALFIGSVPVRPAVGVLSWGVLGTYSYAIFKLGKLERDRGFELVTNRALIGVFSWIALVFFLISLGPLGNPEKGQPALGVYQLFYWLFPGFDAVRAIGRAGIVTSLMLVVLYALYLTHYVRATKVFLALTALIVIENFPRVFPLEPLSAKPDIFQRLSALPDVRDAAIVLPLAIQFDEYRRVRRWSEYANLNIEAMLWGFDSGRFFVNGYSGQRSKVMRELPWSLSGFPDNRSIIALSRIGGLRYIVLRGGKIPGFVSQSFEKALKAEAAHLRLIAKIDTDYLLEFLPNTPLLGGAEVLFPPLAGAELEITIQGHSSAEETAIEVVVGQLDFKSFAIQGATSHKLMLKLPDTTPAGRPVQVNIKSSSKAELVRTRVMSGQFAP